MHETIGQDVDVNFVAYGGAHTTEVEDGYTFTCQVRSDFEGSCNERGNFQHGADECYGNMVQACSQAHVPDYDTSFR